MFSGDKSEVRRGKGKGDGFSGDGENAKCHVIDLYCHLGLEVLIPTSQASQAVSSVSEESTGETGYVEGSMNSKILTQGDLVLLQVASPMFQILWGGEVIPTEKEE